MQLLDIYTGIGNETNLYSDCAENNLQVLEFTAVVSVCIGQQSQDLSSP